MLTLLELSDSGTRDIMQGKKNQEIISHDITPTASGVGAGVWLPTAGGSSAPVAPGEEGRGAIKTAVIKSENKAVLNKLC